jgi:hypothetical protein
MVLDPGGQSIADPDSTWTFFGHLKKYVVNKVPYKILNFFLKYIKIFDKIVKIRIFLTDPDTGDQLIGDPPDPKHCFPAIHF